MSVSRSLNLAARKVGKVFHIIDKTNYAKLCRLDEIMKRINGFRTNKDRSFLKAIDRLTTEVGSIQEFKKQEMNSLDNFEWLFYLSDNQWESFCFQWQQTKQLITKNRQSNLSEQKIRTLFETVQGPYNSKIQCFLQAYKDQKVVADYTKLTDYFKDVAYAQLVHHPLPKEDTKNDSEKLLWQMLQALKEDFREIGLVMKKQMLIFAKTNLEVMKSGANLENFNMDKLDQLIPIAERARQQQIIMARSSWMTPLKDLYNTYKVIGLIDKETRKQGVFDIGFSGKANRAKLLKYTQELTTGVLSAVLATVATIASFGATIILCVFRWIKVFDVLSSFATLIHSFVRAKSKNPEVDLTTLDFRKLSSRTKTGQIVMNSISITSGGFSAGLDTFDMVSDTGATLNAVTKVGYKTGKMIWDTKNTVKNVKEYKDKTLAPKQGAKEKELLKSKANFAKRLKSVEEINVTFNDPLKDNRALKEKCENAKSDLREFMDKMVIWAKKALSYLVKALTKLIKFVLAALIVLVNVVGLLIAGIVLLFKKFCEILGSSIKGFVARANEDIKQGLTYLSEKLKNEIRQIDLRLKQVQTQSSLV